MGFCFSRICRRSGPKNAEEWFGEKKKAELVHEFYKSAAKKPKNTKYPDTLKLKLPMKKNADKKVKNKNNNKFCISDESKVWGLLLY